MARRLGRECISNDLDFLLLAVITLKKITIFSNDFFLGVTGYSFKSLVDMDNGKLFELRICYDDSIPYLIQGPLLDNIDVAAHDLGGDILHISFQIGRAFFFSTAIPVSLIQ